MSNMRHKLNRCTPSDFPYRFSTPSSTRCPYLPADFDITDASHLMLGFPIACGQSWILPSPVHEDAQHVSFVHGRAWPLMLDAWRRIDDVSSNLDPAQRVIVVDDQAEIRPDCAQVRSITHFGGGEKINEDHHARLRLFQTSILTSRYCIGREAR
ncbi:hypothetical protein GALMADRAFT_405893 [Galerina marginata CBS 339.88]|uniref:Uncharacterized protein n=1 Tax=Galerina marginata (strain CBS 339.88) TaxID=685588 RepID=A0A067T583_GALM3|nr:hypothetical protein GALMADRAFT_405893 [Galerina marginata CBS 339.88]